MEHYCKILPEYFEAVKDGRKKFELRKDDRNYQVGDWIYLQEYDGTNYTGRSINRQIRYVLRNYEEYGLKDGFCILSLSDA